MDKESKNLMLMNGGTENSVVVLAKGTQYSTTRGVSAKALTDAIAVGALFSIVTRYADALDFAMPTREEFERAANMLLKRGYAS